MPHDVANRWTTVDSSELYGLPHWGQGYFTIDSDGQMLVHPDRNPDRAINLKHLVDRLHARGLSLPILVRFSGILKDRVKQVHGAFERAIKEYGYQGSYACVYPVKVNQQRQVVEEIVRFGHSYGFGLEAGSKPELMAVVAMADSDAPIVCNGFKDNEFIELALLAQKMGRRVIPVVEKFTDLDLILRHADRLRFRPRFGLRVKLASRGSGRWHASGGYQSKFGLTVTEIVRVINKLKQSDLADCLHLLHFHIGSQVTNIRHIKTALVEAARVYADMVKCGAGLQILDVGGGLGVDYDGSRTDFASSANYSLQEYGNDVIYHIQSVCDDAGIPHPDILSESGRSVVAYHSVLVFDVVGVAHHGGTHFSPPDTLAEGPPPIRDLSDTLAELNVRNVLESFHDAQLAVDTAVGLFSAGHLSLEQRGTAENLFWMICRRIRRLVDDMDYVPDDLAALDRLLSDLYYCNFSLFQSLPDSWAVKQLFPVMPIHRLDQRPSCPAILADITCDSDGKIDQFIDRREVRRALLLHPYDGSSYQLAAFMIGAYQEILGDLHNLFGDTHAVHVELKEDGEVSLESVIQGDTAADVLGSVAFDRHDLSNRWRVAIEKAEQQGLISDTDSSRCLEFYERMMDGYTYLGDSG